MGPRRSLRVSSSAQTPSSKAFSSPAKPSATSSVNKSKKAKTTPKKSEYFNKKRGWQNQLTDELGKVSGADELDSESMGPSTPSAAEEEASGWEDEDATATEPSDEEELFSDEDDDDFGPARKRQKNRQSTGGRGTSAKAKTAQSPTISTTPEASKKGQELWRPGVSTGLGPGTQVVFDKPKARPEGKTKYKDETIHPNTMLFLSDLKKNNDREWFKMHDPDYRQSWKDFTSFLEVLQSKLMEVDDTIPELPIKDVFFRIYRDIRFTSDPTPYKAHFSAAWSRTGRKGPYAVYYIHIQPGNNFAGCGLWHPDANPIAALRSNVDRKPHKIKRILLDPGLRKEILGIDKPDERTAVKEFVKRNSENALKTRPKGYDADHRDIDILRLRNYTLGRKLTDEEILMPKSTERIAYLFSCMKPFVHFLNSVVMPDAPDEDSSDEE